MFLDEALWRMKYKLFQDRVEFLVQLNSYHNFQQYNDEDTVPAKMSYNVRKLGGFASEAQDQYRNQAESLIDFNM